MPVQAWPTSSAPVGAQFIGTAYDATGLKPAKDGGIERVGLPLRPAIANLAEELERDREGARTRNAAELGLDPNRPIIVVTGGSLGAQSINAPLPAVPGSSPKWRKSCI